MHMNNKRLLIKLSGESLMDSQDPSKSFSKESLEKIYNTLSALIAQGYQIGIVNGAGNLVRGKELKQSIGISAVQADQAGMLATLINSLSLQDFLNQKGLTTQTFASFDTPFAPRFYLPAVNHAFNKNTLCIFSGGTGFPFFTTDSCAALRACEIGASLLVKATQVDGIYSENPKINPQAKKFEELTYQECLEKSLQVMDSTAFALCKDNKIPLIICKLEHIIEAITQGKHRTLVKGE